MRIDELMPGDWVHCSKIEKDGYPANCRVVELSCGSICSDTAGIRIHPHVVKGVHASDISPIPLTPEILEKNGFEKCGNHSWHNEILRQIYVRIVCLPEKDRNLRSSVWRFDFPCVVSAGADDVSFRCDYVHELQHVLKLCGIDKQITL